MCYVLALLTMHVEGGSLQHGTQRFTRQLFPLGWIINDSMVPHILLILESCIFCYLCVILPGPLC